MMAQQQPQHLVAKPCFGPEWKLLLGEGLSWDAESKKLSFVDIEGKEVFLFDPESKHLDRWSVPLKPGTVAMCTNSSVRLLGCETGFFTFNVVSGEFLEFGSFAENEGIDNANGGRLNDGRLDRQGRLVCGGYNRSSDGVRHREQYVWQVCGDGSVRKLLEQKVCCANSICFSPDGTTMYFADTPDCVILAYDYDVDSGIASNSRVFVDYKALGLSGFPDGSTVDAAGGLWNAAVCGGKVYHFLPDGKLDIIVDVPGAGCPTCPALGGVNMDTLFITSLAVPDVCNSCGEGISNDLAGNLFSVKVPICGVPEPKFSCPSLFAESKSE